MIVICQNDFPIGVLPSATEEQAEAFIKKMRADSDAAIPDPRQVRPVFHWHDVPEMKADAALAQQPATVDAAAVGAAEDMVLDAIERRESSAPAATDVVQVPRKLINDLLAALQGRRGDLHFRLAVLAAAQQQGGAE